MNKDELNRAISELLGWKSVPSTQGFVLIKPDGENLTSWTGQIIRWPSEAVLWQAHGPNWTGSEEASARLLEMMPDPVLWKGGPERPDWVCHPIHFRHGTMNDHIVMQDPDRKVAIALAAKAWLESRADRMDGQ